MERRQIFKYPISPAGLDIVLCSPRIVLVGPDPTALTDVPHVWIEHTVNGIEMTRVRLTFVGTGQDVPENSEHVGSCMTPPGFMWHVYSERVE